MDSKRDKSSGNANDRLRAMLADGAALSAGRLQCIELGKIKAHMGEEWTKNAKRVEASIRLVLAQHLPPPDLYARMGDLSYMVMFAALDRDAAHAKAIKVAEEIATRLVGHEQAVRLTDVQTVVRGDGVQGASGVKAKAEDDGAKPKDDETAGTLTAAAEPAMGEARQRAVSTPKFVPIAADPPSDLGFVFRPLWAVGPRMLSMYLCVAVKRATDGSVVDDYGSLYASDQASMLARLDGVALDRIAREIDALADKNQKMLIGCPVHHYTLSRGSSRAAYLTQCRSIPDWFRPYIVFEVVGFPEKMPHGRVADTVGILKPYGRAVMARLHKGHKDFQSFAYSGLHAVGMDAALYGLPENEMMASFSEFAGAASAVGVKTYVHGLRSRSLTTGALASGFDYLHSAIAHAAPESPASARRFDFSDLYADLLSPAKS